MVAKTPTKEKRMATALNPNLVRETVKKVDRCMARLQELQYTVTGGTKVISGVKLSPRSTRGYLKTSLRCKQESLRLKNSAARKSPPGKFQGNTTGEWRRMSLPAMLLGETVVEILQATHFAKEVVDAAAKLPKRITINDPKTPDTIRRNKTPLCGNTEQLQARRTREKQRLLRNIRSESDSPPLPRARSRISFKANSPLNRREKKSINRPTVAAHRVSPKNRPWAKKTVLFPNPLFLTTSPSSHQQKFCKTRSPIIARTKKQTPPHKFLVKSPPSSLKSKLRIKNAVPVAPLSSTPMRSEAHRSASKAAVPKLLRRCSFSPSKLANRLVSPLKSRISFQNSGVGLMSGLKQRPGFSTPVRLSSRVGGRGRTDLSVQ